ncbi:Slit 3 protein [Liparis tanakae]|uniref:Slit 3 protein n=1 Tax=Liparis tanakae TaxID=230148 RepID=A0A4Z2I0Q4_9TELE|nr:Slit 3 protein [Liparis tanakae]
MELYVCGFAKRQHLDSIREYLKFGARKLRSESHRSAPALQRWMDEWEKRKGKKERKEGGQLDSNHIGCIEDGAFRALRDLEILFFILSCLYSVYFSDLIDFLCLFTEIDSREFSDHTTEQREQENCFKHADSRAVHQECTLEA